VESDFRLSMSSCGLDDGAEPVVLVGSVFNSAGGSIGLNQAVGALDHVAISGLPLVLNVTGMRVVNGVVEFVVRRRLVKIIQFDSIIICLRANLINQRPITKSTVIKRIKTHTKSKKKRRVFENRILMRIFGPKEGYITGVWRKFHNDLIVYIIRIVLLQ
jgi:hypothetical protein